MYWAVLLASAVLEAVWATALSQGAYVLFLIAATLSMVGLSVGMKRIPVGTAYAVWVGTGAALTVTWAMITGEEAVSAWKIVFLTGIIACVIGLKFLKSGGSGVEGPPLVRGSGAVPELKPGAVGGAVPGGVETTS
ncbi:DMT family transporter [Lentzea flaviverrucosa]|uniref:Quaternary ammonium compound-resistance protein SugE n=1 Tax=Lentzea flaviverrucosa TaxID=200379 RepID=A0A1H9FF86_9PSEU|nr:SMR family transporter [Lentzea flaviverrucosa]RDI35211.1 quaternary ammonium compound-resistance protein SugE [Lentzea flaviverrucosa]SEQ36584.1 quaternary ammonium compound-resistance protein SugE [Lentzea flaviverrucosa]